MGPGSRAALVIPEGELEIRATRAGGPGGQHVNTSSTRIEVRWNLDSSRILSDSERARARARLASRVDAEGWVRVVSAETRSQARNREAAIERLHLLLDRALAVPKPRKATRVPRSEKLRRLQQKRQRAATKRDRGPVRHDD